MSKAGASPRKPFLRSHSPSGQHNALFFGFSIAVSHKLRSFDHSNYNSPRLGVDIFWNAHADGAMVFKCNRIMSSLSEADAIFFNPSRGAIMEPFISDCHTVGGLPVTGADRKLSLPLTTI